MDTNNKNNDLDSEKKKHNQLLSEEKQNTTEKSQGTSENIVERKTNQVIQMSSSASTSSSHSKCNLQFSSSDFRRQKVNSRKRKLSQESVHSSKRLKIGKKWKPFGGRRKSLNKEVDKKYIRQRKHKRQDKKERRTEKSGDEAAYNQAYNKKLDSLAKYGKNFYCPSIEEKQGLRPIYIDGSNVAFSHGQNEKFSVNGLKICIDYFRKRGHKVKAFVPHFRLKKDETTDQKLLHELVRKKLVITTPTLYIQNQRRSPYDDWYIIQSAAAYGGIIISADNFQDIIKWNPNLRSVIEERRLVPTFVDDMIIFPVDPHGNRQNNLEQFLRF